MINLRMCFCSVVCCQSGVALCSSIYSRILPRPQSGEGFFTQSSPRSLYFPFYPTAPTGLSTLTPPHCCSVSSHVPLCPHHKFSINLGGMGDVNRNHTKTPLNYRAFCWFFVGCVKGSLGLVAVFGDLSWTCSL